MIWAQFISAIRGGFEYVWNLTRICRIFLENERRDSNFIALKAKLVYVRSAVGVLREKNCSEVRQKLHKKKHV